MIDPVTGWFEIMQYYDKRLISISKLVETKLLNRYPRPMKIIYDQGSKIISHELRKLLLETEQGITSKTITWVNTTYNEILEQIHQVIGNLVHTFNIRETYVEEENTWLDILAAAFEI